jgi:hypothetical protein
VLSDGRSVLDIDVLLVDIFAVPIYDADDLILLARSPLARLSADEYSYLRELVPEIVMSRRQRARLDGRANSSGTKKRTSGIRTYTTIRESRANQSDSWRKSNL